MICEPPHPRGRQGETFAVLTTEPQRGIAGIHNRQPAIIDPADAGQASRKTRNGRKTAERQQKKKDMNINEIDRSQTRQRRCAMLVIILGGIGVASQWTPGTDIAGWGVATGVAGFAARKLWSNGGLTGPGDAGYDLLTNASLGALAFGVMAFTVNWLREPASMFTMGITVAQLTAAGAWVHAHWTEPRGKVHIHVVHAKGGWR